MFSLSQELVGHAGAIYTSLVHGDFLYTASADKYVVRWSLVTGLQDIFVIKTSSNTYALSIDGNNNLWIALSSGDIHVIDTLEKKEIKFFKTKELAIFSLKYNPLLNLMYAGSSNGELYTFDCRNLKLVNFLELACGKIRRIVLNVSGKYMALTGGNGELILAECEGFKLLQRFQAHENGTSSAIFQTSNSDLLISGGKDAHLKIWDWKSATCLQSIPAHNFVIYDLLIIGDLLISASRDKSIKIWTVDNLSIVEKLDFKKKGHLFSVNSLSYYSENKFISVSDDKKIKIWAKNEYI